MKIQSCILHLIKAIFKAKFNNISIEMLCMPMSLRVTERSFSVVYLSALISRKVTESNVAIGLC